MCFSISLMAEFGEYSIVRWWLPGLYLNCRVEDAMYLEWSHNAQSIHAKTCLQRYILQLMLHMIALLLQWDTLTKLCVNVIKMDSFDKNLHAVNIGLLCIHLYACLHCLYAHFWFANDLWWSSRKNLAIIDKWVMPREAKHFDVWPSC